MAMKKSTPKPPPAPRRGGNMGSGNPTNLGYRTGTKVRKITGTKKALTKSAVRNPDAPKPIGSGAARGLVRVITPSETAMKKGKTGVLNKKKTTGRNPGKYKSSLTDKMIADTQNIRSKGYQELKPGEKMAANTKGGKPSKVAPKKKTEAPKTTTKRRIFVGRGRGGGGGGLFGRGGTTVNR